MNFSWSIGLPFTGAVGEVIATPGDVSWAALGRRPYARGNSYFNGAKHLDRSGMVAVAELVVSDSGDGT